MAGNGILPVLSAEEWCDLPPTPVALSDLLSCGPLAYTVGDEAKVIALMNANMDAGDPRKMTHELVDRLRRAAAPVSDEYSGDAWLYDLADVIASYLPPRS